MKPLSIDSQVALLKVAAKTRVGRNLQHWMQGSAVALALLSALIWNPIPLMLALFLGIVGIAERRAVPNILNALRAYETGVAAPGEISISTICWDTDTHYHALVREPGRPDWTYEFIPQGWQPDTARFTPTRTNPNQPTQNSPTTDRSETTKPASREAGFVGGEPY